MRRPRPPQRRPRCSSRACRLTARSPAPAPGFCLPSRWSQTVVDTANSLPPRLSAGTKPSQQREKGQQPCASTGGQAQVARPHTEAQVEGCKPSSAAMSSAGGASSGSKRVSGGGHPSIWARRGSRTRAGSSVRQGEAPWQAVGKRAATGGCRLRARSARCVALAPLHGAPGPAPATLQRRGAPLSDECKGGGLPTQPGAAAELRGAVCAAAARPVRRRPRVSRGAATVGGAASRPARPRRSNTMPDASTSAAAAPAQPSRCSSCRTR